MEYQNPLDTFFHEAEDLLTQIEEIALNALSGELDLDALNHLFRAFHTIKGSSSMFGLDGVAGFTHHLETVLDMARSGDLAVTGELVDVVLQSRDVIRDLLGAAIHGHETEVSRQAELERQLLAMGGGSQKAPQQPQTTIEPSPVTDELRMGWRIRFRPDPDLIRRGQSLPALFDDLEGLGKLVVCGDTDHLPALEAMDADRLYLRFALQLESSCSLNDVRDVFIFVEDDSEIVIEPWLEASPGKASAPAASAGTCIAPIPHGSDAAIGKPPADKTADGEAGPAAFKAGAHNAAPTAMVRVAAGKLDRLVNLVGELVINQSRLTEAASRRNDQELMAPVEEIERLVSELRDSVLGIRMTPIGATFNRFKRLVHDLSEELGKEIDLVTEGAETELDKTVLDQLGDPLVHLIRNSLDHGLEMAAERLEKGKSPRGTVRLTAAHVGSNVVVSIIDDGRGLNAALIRAKAVEKQLIAADAVLSEREIFNLIFAPGFSTAKQVTSVSGRGVGMDVVKRQIEALRGSIQISSQLGQGTTISLTLPLTLAIIDGLLVEVDQDQFIVPMSAVLESVELSAEDRGRNNGRNVFAVRGELMPYIDLRRNFQLGGAPPDIEKIVIVRHQDERVGLTVDRVIGSHQTVIQNLGRFYKNTAVVSGATITGDGRVALILDIAGLVQQANNMPAQRMGTVDAAAMPRPMPPAQYLQ